MNRKLRIKVYGEEKKNNTAHTSLFIIPHSERGITLIELLLVMAIVALIGLSSVAFYARFFTQNAVSNTVDQLTSQLHKAQIYAMAGKNESHWGVDYRSNTITLYRGNSYATRVIAVDEKFSVPSNITVTTFDINFWPKDGTPSASATITISGGGNSETVTVNSQGVVNR